MGCTSIQTYLHEARQLTAIQEQPEKVDEESSEEESSEEESSEEEGDKPKQDEMTREQRREAAKARKQAAIAKKSQKVPEAGDLPTSDEESDDDMPANPNHTTKARTQAAKAPVDPEAAPAKDKGKQDTSQLSRREREALEKQQAKERYDKLHAEGKTEQARADLERLKLVRERRDAEAARKKAEAEERAELEKEKAELMAREARRREQALGKANRLAKGGKKK